MLTVWREPELDHIYCLGVATSEPLVHGDYSCVQGLEVRTGDQVAIWHGHIPPD